MNIEIMQEAVCEHCRAEGSHYCEAGERLMSERLTMAMTKLRGCADGSDSPSNWIALVRDECRAVLAELERAPVKTPTCPPELMGPRPCTGTYCEDEEREDLEAEWLEEHPPGSACTSGCGYCGRCT